MTSDTFPEKRSFKRSARFPDLHLLAAVGILLLAVNCLLATFGSLLAPHSVSELIGGGAFGPPSEVAVLGTDYLGRDLLSRLLHGAKYSVGIAAAATCLGFLVGMAIGFAAAELRGAFDSTIGWLCDILLSFPALLLALLAITAVGSSIPVLVGSIAFIQLPRVIRVSRAVGIGISTLDFVEVARARGESLASILLREILPNSIRPLAVEFGLRMSFAVLFISSLSFLGMGIQPPEADWGSMVRENLPGIYYSAGAAVYPALLIAMLVLGINLTVDWLSGTSRGAASGEMR
jgi:peptide/nickel transport system permease protein